MPSLPSADPMAVRAELDRYVRELDELSKGLAGVSRNLEPVEKEYNEFVDNFELGLYDRSLREDDFKLPSAAMRLKLAHRDMPPELYGRYVALTSKRDRLRKRISDMKAQADSQRSILSALKAEMECSR